MISYTSFNNALQDSNPSIMEFDKIDDTLKKFPYFNVLRKIKENEALLDFMSSEKYTAEALSTYYDLSPEQATVNYTFSSTKGIRGVKPKQQDTQTASAIELDTADSETSPSQKTNPAESPKQEESAENMTPADAETTKQTSEEIDIVITATSDLSSDTEATSTDADSQLTHQRSFSDWMRTIRKKKRGAEEDRNKVEDIKAQWQKKRILEMQEEDAEPIDDEVFDMVMNSVTESGELVSEPLAELYLKQGYKEKSKAIYHKLILKYPEKSSYFAGLIRKIDT